MFRTVVVYRRTASPLPPGSVWKTWSPAVLLLELVEVMEPLAEMPCWRKYVTGVGLLGLRAVLSTFSLQLPAPAAMSAMPILRDGQVLWNSKLK